jgi:hypothetical protein
VCARDIRWAFVNQIRQTFGGPALARYSLVCLAAGVAGLVAFAASAASAASDPGQFLELWVQYDDGRLTLANQVVHAGKLPPARGELFEKGHWLIHAHDATGAVRYSMAIPDPCAVYVDRLMDSPSEPGLIVGERRTAPSAFFVLSFPYDRQIVQLTIWRLTKSMNIERAPPGSPQVGAVERARRRHRGPIALSPLDALEPIGALPITVP